MRYWKVPQVSESIYASVRLPGSKSQTARELLLCAIADSAGSLISPLYARDTDLMVKGLRALGATFTPWPPENSDQVTVSPIPIFCNARFSSEECSCRPAALESKAKENFGKLAQIECGLSGTVMRFLPVLTVALGIPARFTADKEANSRPMLPLLEALEQLGARWESENPSQGIFPFMLYPPEQDLPSAISIDPTESSQFLSALLLSSTLFSNDFTVRSETEKIPSLPHVEMTLECLKLRGANVVSDSDDSGRKSWKIEGKQLTGKTLKIEPDLSNAGPFLAAAGILGGKVSVPNWPAKTTQAGNAWRELLPEFGMKLSYVNSTLAAQGVGDLQPIDRNFSQIGELVPTAAALAAHANGKSVLRDLHHLRGHETDRLEALQTELNNLGIATEVTAADDLVIYGVPPKKISNLSTIEPVVMHSYADHRMATFAALMGLCRPVQIDDVTVTSKTMPNFVQMWIEFTAGNPNVSGGVIEQARHRN